MLRKYLFPKFANEDILQNARLRLLHGICLIFVAPTIALAVFGLVKGWTGQLDFVSLVMQMALPAGFIFLARSVRRGAPISVATAFLLCLVYSFALTLRAYAELFSGGAVFYLALPLLSGFLLGYRAGIAFSAVLTMIYVGSYFAGIDNLWIRPISATPSVAVETVLSYVGFGLLIKGCVFVFLRVMEDVVSRLRQTNSDLNAYKSNLEDIVEERTETIRQQASELEKSLEIEKQTSALQNQLVSVVSHEIRTPLAIIDGAARRLAKRADDLSSDQVVERTDVIRKSVLRLTELMERTLDTARYSEGQIKMDLQPVDLKAVLAAVVEQQAELNPEHDIQMDLADFPETISGDKAMLGHLLTNLVSNAVKYSADNPKVEISSEIQGDELVLRVKDFGVGIPKDELANVSSRFFRASTANGIPGTGIGLNLAEKIAREHCGTLTLDSVEGEWTEVTLTLPANGCQGRVCGTGLAADVKSDTASAA
tara:strand:- start:20602 stop:22050 length:1449 start_codon:yes stop_codon:yes gene_type:complete